LSHSSPLLLAYLSSLLLSLSSLLQESLKGLFCCSRYLVSRVTVFVAAAPLDLSPLQESLKRLFCKETEEGFLGASSNATFEVLPSKDIKVAGLLGPAARMEKKSPHIADTEVCVCAASWFRLTLDAGAERISALSSAVSKPKTSPSNMFNYLFVHSLIHWVGQ
jgi:hypothetical protein